MNISYHAIYLFLNEKKNQSQSYINFYSKTSKLNEKKKANLWVRSTVKL